MLEVAAFLLLSGASLGPDSGSGTPSPGPLPRQLSIAGDEVAAGEVPIPWHDSILSRRLPDLDPLPSQQQPEPARRDEGLSLGVAAHARYSFPFGWADRNAVEYAGVVFVSHSLSWNDLFDPGWGFDIELDLFFGGQPAPQKGTPGSRFGVVALFERDTYGGNHLSGSLGGSIDVGDLTMSELLVGGVYQQGLSPGVYTKGHIAVGAVHYSAVHATFSGLGFVQTRDELLADTWTIASDFRAEIGLRAGPIGVSFGIGLRIQAPPSEGTRVSLNSGAFWTFDLNLGVDIGF